MGLPLESTTYHLTPGEKGQASRCAINPPPIRLPTAQVGMRNQWTCLERFVLRLSLLLAYSSLLEGIAIHCQT